VKCLKRKHTNKSTKGAKRSSELLEIFQTDICGPFPTPCSNGRNILFHLSMNTQHLYVSIFCMKNKSEALDAFKVFKAKGEKQKEKKIKVVIFDRCEKYYGRYC